MGEVGPVKKDWRPTPDQMMCRDVQHSWGPHNAWRDGRGFVRVLRCSRCGTFKTQRLDREGYVLTTTMKYPTGYLRPEGGRLTGDERAYVRLSHLNHIPEPSTGEEDE